MNILAVNFLVSLAGLALIVVEMFVPGGIFGATGGGIILFAVASLIIKHSLVAGVALLLVDGVVFMLLFNLIVKFLPRTKMGKKVMLSKNVDSTTVNPDDLKSLIGRTTTVMTVLKPTGTIEIDNHRYNARTHEGIINKGQTVEIIDIEANNLIVKQTQSDNN